MKSKLLLVVFVILPLSGCLDSAEQPVTGVDPAQMGVQSSVNALGRDKRPLAEPSRDDQVIHNCYIVRYAAEEWSRENGGGYPSTPFNDTNSYGNTLIDLLPDGDYLENPYTGQRNLPQYVACPSPGKTEYLSYTDEGEGVVGYMITGWGAEGELVRMTAGWPDSLMDLDSVVVAHCVVVQRAAERFALENAGVYPGNLNDETPNGNTLIDFLPGGQMLQNPFHWLRTEPIDGPSALMGEIGYVVALSGGVNRGYTITGTDRYWNVIVIFRDPNRPDRDHSAKITIRKRVQ